jgi:hypothetical protein
MSSKLGIVAGGGDLPGRIAAACRATGREVFVLALQGQADPGIVAGAPHAWVRLGAGGTALELLRQAGVRDLVLAGWVRRPSLAAIRPDRITARFLAEVGARAFGDDSLLRLIARRLEQEGFRILSPQSILDDVLAPEGPFGRLAPDAEAEQDIARGIAVARALGAADVGQAVVVQHGLVLAVEAIEGTDAMLARAGALRREGPGGVLVKTSKPQQDRRLDLPAIGVETVRQAAAAGLRGIAVEAGGCLALDRPAIAAAADAAGLFVTGVRAGRAG